MFSIFTFHNVSINTDENGLWLRDLYTLHSTMFLLIQIDLFICGNFEIPLHSTMFLLIQTFTPLLFHKSTIFTFHNVSINTTELTDITTIYAHFTFHNVSINTERDLI